MNPLLFAFALTLFAGLATGIGSVLAFMAPQRSGKFLSLALGFSAGVMVYVSFVEILPKAVAALSEVSGYATWLATGAFFIGVIVAALLDLLVPHPESSHHSEDGVAADAHNQRKLLRMGLFAALALALHNFPEGLATFMGALQDPALGVAIAIAIAIHNIPEGIAVSVPIYHATGSRAKAFWYSLLSGMAEPVGAITGFFLLQWLFNDLTFGLVFAGVAGIMVYISIDELLPAAREYGKAHHSMLGFVCGMAVMALSLLLLAL